MPNYPMTAEKYIYYDGTVCPNCGHPGVDPDDHIEIDGDGAHQGVTCGSCLATWDDQYKLIGYDNLEDVNGNKIEVPND